MVDVNTQFGGFLTTQGAAKKTNCDALGVPWQLTHMRIGDANGADPVPAPGQTQLINQVYRAQLNQLYVSPVDPNVLVAELVLPPNVGGWWIRELALEDVDGVFSAVANCAPSYKPLLAQNNGRNQVVRMHIITDGTANVQLKIDPSVVLATRAYCDGLITAHLAASDPHKQYRLRGGFISLNANTQLTAAHEGVVVLDAAGGDRTLTLPAADADFGIRDILVRRLDNSGNRAKVIAAGNNKIKFHTHLNAAGYAFLYLMGAGDWWHLRSDGEGNWWPLGRHDSDALGRPVFESTTMVSPGGWGVFAGSMFNRADWPWLWDHGQASGMLTTEAARVGMEGGWTSGDGALTFRGPEGRGEFLRLLSDGRGIDTGRVAGSYQADAYANHSHVVTKWAASGFDSTGGPFLVGADTAGYQDISALTGLSGGTETRPRNIAYPGRIKLI